MHVLLLATVVSLSFWMVSGDEVAELRRGGQATVDDLHARVLKAAPGRRAELEARLDRVCGQRDCLESRLYWYTDLDEAKEAARRLRRPILALQLLGRLDEELSCANSRLFRTLLYADDSISAVMRERYVLYWRSERPVPHVTIDMGDGRVIRQTITGNSVHYLLDENGEPLDALPGLYSPQAFRQVLEEWLDLVASLGGLDAATRRETLRRHHARFAARPVVAWAPNGETPTAIEASSRVVTKTAIERPMLAQLRKPASSPAAGRIPLSDWAAAGEQRMDEVQLSAGAVRLIGKKQFGSDPIDPDALRALLDGIRRNVAADTALNEAMMRPRVHQWFAEGEVADLGSLNARVYRELFLTPADDPWLGLQPADVFTAIGR